MLTALNIEEHDGGLFHFLRRNRIRVEHRYCDSASLKCVTYEHHRGRIGWNTIDRFVKAQRSRLLCTPSIELPTGYKRYVSHELSRRMSENAALYLLRSVKRKGIKVVLVDPSGENVGICEYLTEYCDPLYVVSEATAIYTAQTDYLLNEKGAALRVCRGIDCLRNADLILAPEQLLVTLPCPPDALILTGEKPYAPQRCTAIWDYEIDLPLKYKDLCPDYLDEMYFAEALFTLAQGRELGSEIFTRCGDGCVLHTRPSLIETLKKRINS